MEYPCSNRALPRAKSASFVSVPMAPWSPGTHEHFASSSSAAATIASDEMATEPLSPGIHGGEQRAARGIEFRELQAALQNDSEPTPARDGCLKYEVNGVTLVVAGQPGRRREVTSYRKHRPVRDHAEEELWRIHGAQRRFSIGTRVECRMGDDEWIPGIVRQLEYVEPWPRELGKPREWIAPYQVVASGYLVFVPEDTDEFIRAADDLRGLHTRSADSMIHLETLRADSHSTEYIYGATADQLAALVEDQDSLPLLKSGELACECFERLATLLGKGEYDGLNAASEFGAFISPLPIPMFKEAEISEHARIFRERGIMARLLELTKAWSKAEVSSFCTQTGSTSVTPPESAGEHPYMCGDAAVARVLSNATWAVICLAATAQEPGLLDSIQEVMEFWYETGAQRCEGACKEVHLRFCGLVAWLCRPGAAGQMLVLESPSLCALVSRTLCTYESFIEMTYAPELIDRMGIRRAQATATGTGRVRSI